MGQADRAGARERRWATPGRLPVRNGELNARPRPVCLYHSAARGGRARATGRDRGAALDSVRPLRVQFNTVVSGGHVRIALSFPGVHQRGGAERVAAESARFLSARGHEVHLFANDWDGNPGEVCYHHVAARRSPGFLTAPSFYRSCSDALDASAFDAVGAFGAPSPLGGVYWAQSVHKAWLEHSRTYRPPWSRSRWQQRLNPAHPLLLDLERRHFASGAHSRYVALTPVVRSDLERYYGVPQDVVDVVPVGFDPELFSPSATLPGRDRLRAELGYRNDDRVLLFVANELQRKGFGPLLRAVARLRDPRVKLLVVGRVSPGPYAGEIRRLGLDDCVRFIGSATRVAQFYGAADVFALPTQYEAWGLVIVEALACGVPVLTSAVAGASVAVTPGRTGQLLDRADDENEITEKLRVLFGRSDYDRDEISQSVQGYRWDSVLGKYEDVLLRERV